MAPLISLWGYLSVISDKARPCRAWFWALSGLVRRNCAVIAPRSARLPTTDTRSAGRCAAVDFVRDRDVDFAAMAEDTNTPPQPAEQPAQAPAISEPPVLQPSAPEDRSELLDRARMFLRSPQVVHEDAFSKRKFLVQKGLNDPEIETLLQELVSRTICSQSAHSCLAPASSNASPNISSTSAIEYPELVDRRIADN